MLVILAANRSPSLPWFFLSFFRLNFCLGAMMTTTQFHTELLLTITTQMMKIPRFHPFNPSFFLKRRVFQKYVFSKHRNFQKTHVQKPVMVKKRRKNLRKKIRNFQKRRIFLKNTSFSKTRNVQKRRKNLRKKYVFSKKT